MRNPDTGIRNPQCGIPNPRPSGSWHYSPVSQLHNITLHLEQWPSCSILGWLGYISISSHSILWLHLKHYSSVSQSRNITLHLEQWPSCSIRGYIWISSHSILCYDVIMGFYSEDQVAAPSLWNCLTLEARTTNNINEFKHHVKSFLFRKALIVFVFIPVLYNF